MFNDQFKKIRLENNLTQEELAKALDVSKSTISMYETGSRLPGLEMLEVIADFFNIDMNKLTGKQYNKTSSNNILDIKNIYPVELKKFPLLGNIACGEPIFADNDKENYIVADSSIHADFCLHAQGDSMINARILDGDIVFIKEQPLVNNGEIVAVIIGDEATLKRVYYDKEQNRLMLVSENPLFKPLVYFNEELDNIRILGKAVFFTSIL